MYKMLILILNAWMMKKVKFFFTALFRQLEFNFLFKFKMFDLNFQFKFVYWFHRSVTRRSSRLLTSYLHTEFYAYLSTSNHIHIVIISFNKFPNWHTCQYHNQFFLERKPIRVLDNRRALLYSIQTIEITFFTSFYIYIHMYV